MDDDHIKALVENEKEWRRVLTKEVFAIRKDMANLKVKVATFGAIFGALGASVIEFVSRGIK